jgi:SAM-dependent methyltransferase
VPDSVPLFQPAWSVVAGLTAIGASTSVLDVGCGTGAFCAYAAGLGARVHGLDGMPDRVAEARRRTPGGDFRVGLIEHLPWPDDAFDVVTGFNAFQYALDLEVALAEACRVTRPGGRVAVCKWGRPSENEFFAVLAALQPGRVRLDELPREDPVDAALRRLGLCPALVAAGDVPATMAFPSEQALCAAVAAADEPTWMGDPAGARERLLRATEPYRRPDGGYAFANRLAYRIVAV